MAEEAEEPGTVVEAVGSASASSSGGLWSAADMEKAMADAITACHEEGIFDDDEIRDRMRQAREDLKADRRAQATEETEGTDGNA